MTAPRKLRANFGRKRAKHMSYVEFAQRYLGVALNPWQGWFLDAVEANPGIRYDMVRRTHTAEIGPRLNRTMILSPPASFSKMQS